VAPNFGQKCSVFSQNFNILENIRLFDQNRPKLSTLTKTTTPIIIPQSAFSNIPLFSGNLTGQK